MIKRLRAKFIRIAMLSVALVLLALSLIVNAANFISINQDLNRTLDMIYENQGTIPLSRFADEAAEPPKKTTDSSEASTPPSDIPPAEAPAPLPTEPERLHGPFNAETPYSTRYFYLRFSADGTLDRGIFSHIAAVTEDDADTYIKAALQHGAGYGFYTSGYKFRVIKEGESRCIAVFLDCYQELRAVRTLAAQPRQAASGSVFRSPKVSARRITAQSAPRCRKTESVLKRSSDDMRRADCVKSGKSPASHADAGDLL